MYNWVKPKCVIPVHGEHRHMREHVDFAKKMQIPQTLLIENGDIIKIFSEKTPEIIDKAPFGRMYLDGSVKVSEDSQSIKERKNLSSNGFMEITIMVTPKGNIHNKPILTFRGLPINETDEFVYGLEEEIEKAARTFSLNNKNQESNLIDSLKSICKKYSKEKTGKKPITNVNLVRI